MKIAFDVGACTGESLHRFSDYDIIYAFEPCKWSFERLVCNHKHNTKIIFVPYAVNDVQKQSDFYFYDSYGYSSLLEFDKSGSFFRKSLETDPSINVLLEISQVNCIRLDNFMNEKDIDYIDYLKIDTQGNDLNVIKSLGSMIFNVKVIELEIQIQPLYKNSYSKQDAFEYMKSRHFVLHEEKPNGYDLDGYEHVLIFNNQNYSN
jgi:FkbM family methyltransferase